MRIVIIHHDCCHKHRGRHCHRSFERRCLPQYGDWLKCRSHFVNISASEAERMARIPRAHEHAFGNAWMLVRTRRSRADASARAAAH